MKKHDKEELRTVQTKIKNEIKKKKENYRQRLENKFASKDLRGAWKALETMTNYKPKKKTIQIDNAQHFANEMNVFYSRFDNRNFRSEQAKRWSK